MSQPGWPSVEQQLMESRVIPGSALEQLIRENQDFHVLRPEEVSDTLGLPLWLRVYWRRSHPELSYPGNDPTGGYPRALRNLLAWMLTHQDLQARPPPDPAGRAGAAAPPAATAGVTVGGDLWISGAAASPRSESDIRVNFNNPNHIIAASNDIEASGWQAQFYSRDGGSAWGDTYLPQVSATDLANSDPAVDWTSDGTAWAITIAIGQTKVGGYYNAYWVLRAFKSADGGATWAYDSEITAGQSADDKPAMWVDHSPASPYKDTIYVIWHSGQPAYISRRTPAGAWQLALRVSGAETQGTAVGGDIKTNSFGDVFAFWPDTTGRKLYVAKSTNGGAAFAAPVPIASTFGYWEIQIPSAQSRAPLIYVAAGAYRTAAKNLVYAGWVDMTGDPPTCLAPGCNAEGDAPAGNVSSPCKTRIWFSRSTDGGATWEAPRKINDQAFLNDQFHPRLAVDEANGQLLISYYDTIGDPGRRKTDVWYQTSTDDGVTWNTPVKVTTAETDETSTGANGNQYGDYIGLSGYQGVFFPSWTDRRSGGYEQIWTARVDLGAAPFPDGTLIKASGAEIDRMDGGQRRWVPDSATFNCMGLNWNAVQTIADSEWSQIPQGAPYPSRADNTLLQGVGDPAVFVMMGCQRHWIPDPQTFNAHGFNWNAIQQVADFDLSAIPLGAPIPSVYNNAVFVSQHVLGQMSDDQQVQVTMRNTGNTTWAAGGSNPYQLGSQNPQDNTIWGFSRVDLPAPVAPGCTVTFDFIIFYRPPGYYNFQWRMVQQGIAWFGDDTPNAVIHVIRPT